MTIPFHPFADLFPMIGAADWPDFVADIRVNDVREKIVILDGKILDGRNRYKAGIEAGRLAEDVDWKKDKHFTTFRQVAPFMDPLAWVLSKNLHRRHLSDSQRALVAADLARLVPGRPSAESPRTKHDAAPDNSANLRDFEEAPVMTQAEAAEALHVSERSVSSARKVLDAGAPELVAAVRDGAVAVSAAAEIADMPVETQADLIRAADPKAFARVAKERRAVKQAEKKARRDERQKAMGKANLAAGERKFPVLYVDPEWPWEAYSRETGMDRSEENHYPTSSLEELRARNIAGLAEADAVMFCWIRPGMMRASIEIIEDAWGFKVVSEFVWPKDKFGKGYWNRNQHEILVVATRGNPPCPAPGENWSSLLWGDRTEHSAKPESALFLIEAYFPDAPKIELNRRGCARDGWWAWGNEVTGDAARGIVVDENGFADASHLPLPPRVGQDTPHPTGFAGHPPHEGEGEDATQSRVAGEAPETSSAGKKGDKDQPPLSQPEAGHAPEADVETPAQSLASAPVPFRLASLAGADLAGILAEKAQGLPRERAKLVEAYQEAMTRYDAAMRAGDETAARDAGERMGAVLYRVNGNRVFALDVNPGPSAIRKATAAPMGAVPIWGQNGCFEWESEATGILIVDCRWPTIGLYATSDTPFFDTNGFVSLTSSADGLGLTVEEFVAAVAADLMTERSGQLVVPQTIFRIGRVGPVPAHGEV